MPDKPGHWRGRPLETLSKQEWESLCDGCARCCLVQLEDDETGEIHLTRLACRHLALASCRCTVYDERNKVQPDCIPLTPDKLPTLSWMPESCAYRRLGEGQALPDWHPLLAGHAKGVPKVCDFAIPESELCDTDEWEAFIIESYGS